MSCTTTTGMYLNVSTDICASASASRSGNTITVSGTFSVSQGNSWNLNAIYAYVDGQTGWTRVKPYTNYGGTWYADFSFSFTDSGGGTRSYTAIFQVWNNAESGTVGNSASVGFSVSYSAGGTAPTGLSMSGATAGTDWVSATVSVTGWGGLGDANSRYRNFSVMATSDKPSSPRRYQRVYGNTLSSVITANNSTQYGSMTITPNTRYWLWWYATNGTYNVSSPDTSTTTIVTKAPAPTISSGSSSPTSAVVNYSCPADGGFYNKNVQYKLGNGSWTSGATVSGSNYASGSFTISGLDPNTSYAVYSRSSTTAGNTDGNSITITTLATAPTVVIGTVTTSAATFSYTLPSDNGQYGRELSYSIDNGSTWTVIVNHQGGSPASGSFTVSNLSSGAAYTLRTRVVTAAGTTNGTPISFDTLPVVQHNNLFYGPVSGYSRCATSLYGSHNAQSTAIYKIYGSANNQAKLTYQGFGHLQYGP